VGDRLKILVVEDDSTYREFVAMVLRGAGHEVFEAEDGASARELARVHAPDAIILDLRLPDATGYAIATELRRAIVHANTSIILLTADRFPERDAAEAAGIDIVISKPVEADLVTGIVDHVRARRLRRNSSP